MTECSHVFPLIRRGERLYATPCRECSEPFRPGAASIVRVA